MGAAIKPSLFGDKRMEDLEETSNELTAEEITALEEEFEFLGNWGLEELESSMGLFNY